MRDAQRREQSRGKPESPHDQKDGRQPPARAGRARRAPVAVRFISCWVARLSPALAGEPRRPYPPSCAPGSAAASTSAPPTLAPTFDAASAPEPTPAPASRRRGKERAAFSDD